MQAQRATCQGNDVLKPDRLEPLRVDRVRDITRVCLRGASGVQAVDAVELNRRPAESALSTFQCAA